MSFGISCQLPFCSIDNEDGTCSVEYIPEEEGDYDVNVKYDDRHIPHSPFKVNFSFLRIRTHFLWTQYGSCSYLFK